MRSFLLQACVLSCAVFAGEPAPAAPGALTLKTERIVIFKDGYGLFVKTAAGTADAEGRVFTEDVPDGAVLGCFWASTADGKAVAMMAGWDERKTERVTETACVTTLELLRANKGKAVKLGLVPPPTAQPNVRVELSGTVVEVLELPPDPKAPPTPPTPGQPHYAYISARWNPDAVPPGDGEAMREMVRELVPRGGVLVVVDTKDEGRVVLPVDQVRSVSGNDIITKMQRREEVTVNAKQLKFDLGKDAAGKAANLRIFYFSEGVRWIPTYRLSGELVDSGELALQGEVLNEAEDFANTEIDLVVGVPSFRFKTLPSPLTLEATLRSGLAASNPQLMGQMSQMSNAMFGNRSGERRGRGGDAGDGAEAAVAMQDGTVGAGAHDLFVYSGRTLSLKKGARATLPLWQSTTALRHLYTLDLKIVRDPRTGQQAEARREEERLQPNGPSPLRFLENQVWHQMELSNASKVPWTTGAALILRGNLPLGQDLLTYTAAGGKSLLPVTVAIDMRGQYQEEELKREPNAMNWAHSQYARVTKRATITITNQRKEKSQTRVSLSLGGRAEKPSDGGVVTLNDHRSADWAERNWQGVNNHSDVVWELALEAGQSKTLTVEFSFYVQ